MNYIEMLYYNIDKLSNFKDMEEIKEACDNMKYAIGEDVYEKCEDEICICLTANEKQGFIQGFQYAVSLLTNASGKADCLDELMENEYTAMSCMDTPMSDLVSKALEIVRKKITDKEYLEIESNMTGSYNEAEKFGFGQGFMRGIVVAKGGAI